jgi:hypothetical protein
LAESGQQTPIVVVLGAEPGERYLVIDGHKRIAALKHLGRDTIEATVWTMSAAEALLLERSLRCRSKESALEQGWLLVEMERSFGYGLEELARRFDRSVSWVSRRGVVLLPLVVLPDQPQIPEIRLQGVSHPIPVTTFTPAAWMMLTVLFLRSFDLQPTCAPTARMMIKHTPLSRSCTQSGSL